MHMKRVSDINSCSGSLHAFICVGMRCSVGRAQTLCWAEKRSCRLYNKDGIMQHLCDSWRRTNDWMRLRNVETNQFKRFDWPPSRRPHFSLIKVTLLFKLIYSLFWLQGGQSRGSLSVCNRHLFAAPGFNYSKHTLSRAHPLKDPSSLPSIHSLHQLGWRAVIKSSQQTRGHLYSGEEQEDGGHFRRCKA